jgi:protein O-GlcNAc transferase
MEKAEQFPQRLSAGWKAIEGDDLRGAEEIARRALAQDAHDAEALRLLGASLLYQARYEEALVPLREVHLHAPRRGSGHKLGYCYLALGQHANAERVLEPEVRKYPDLINARNALGVSLINQSRREDALAVFLEAAKLDPASAEANSNAGSLLTELGRQEEAIAYLRRALQASPKLAEAHFNLGVALQHLKRYEEAAASLYMALDLAPRMSYALGHLVWNEISRCRWDRIDSRVAELRRQVREGIPAAPFTFLVVSDTPREQRQCAELHVRTTVAAQSARMWNGERYRHEKIRVAYLSADFHEHATGQLMAGLFEHHDRSRFETVAISYGPVDGSPMRGRLMRAFGKFVEARTLADAHVARMLRDMEIDIAVDLKGHTTDSRFGILAYRPAPVQVAYLGYPGTTGADLIDYVLADRFVLPETEHEYYTEKVAYLPDCYQVNDSTRDIAERTPVRAEMGLPQDGFVFCCFNNSYKITPQMFDVWMRLLREVSSSVLWLLEDNVAARQNLVRAAQARGVPAVRLVFARRLPPADHLARHRLADLFLDTLPCNAHTTASDALWAGLPLLTCAGGAFAGRVAGSLLQSVGLPELIKHSLPENEALALDLAKDRRLLSGLRARLAANRGTAPLFDTERMRRSLESAYQAMWQIQQRAEPPRAFSVEQMRT